MNTLTNPRTLPDAVDQLGASVLGLTHRRQRSSGVLWRDGVLVGSAHALWRVSSVSVVRPDGEQVVGEVRGVDGATDLAAVAFAAADMPLAERAAGPAPRVGDVVFAVGRDPSGVLEASFGHIGSTAGAWRTWRGGQVDSLIRLDGGLYPGLSGAPVGDASGRVLGVASSAFSRHHGVVLPAATVDRVLDQLLAHGRVARGYLGIAAQPVRAQLDGTGVDGLLVSSVAADGPAARGGLLVGDVIVKVAGAAVATLDDLRAALQVGTQMQAQVSRGGHGYTLALDVAERPQSRCG